MAQKLKCVVERIVDHGEQVYTVALRPERPVPRFRAGQFLHLALDPYDPTGFWPESRVFSIASPPARARSRADHLRRARAVHGADGSASCVEGRQVWIKLPYGDFVDRRPRGRRAVRRRHGHDGVHRVSGGSAAATRRVGDARLRRPQQPAADLPGRRRALRAAGAVARRGVFRRAGRAATSRRRRMPRTRLGRRALAAAARVRSRPTYYISGPPPMLRGIARGPARPRHRAGGDSH